MLPIDGINSSSQNIVFNLDDPELSELGAEVVGNDNEPEMPIIIGDLSRGFDPTFPGRYLQFYRKLATDPLAAIQEVRDDPVKFIEYCCKTKSRDKQTGKITILCFELYESQKQAIRELHECRLSSEPAAFLKSRQQGASWMCICYAFYLAIFYKNETILCTSKTDEDLHEIGNLKSFMEKIKFLYRNLSPYLRKNLIYKFESKKYLFQINDSTIEGGVGEDPARGGTYTITFNDEFAANKNANNVLMSIAACCNCNIFISTKKDKGDVYDQILNSPNIRKIRLYWRDDPQILDKEAYKAKYISKYGEINFKVEIDMQYAEPDELLIFDRDILERVKLKKPKTKPQGDIVAGYDVAGLGSDSNAVIVRQGHSIIYKKKWPKCFSHESVNFLIECFEECPFDILMFDEIGVGYAIASEFARRIDTLPFLVQGIHVNSEAAEKGVEDQLLGDDDRVIYFNLRSKLHFQLKNILENTFVDANVYDQSELLYLNDEEIIKEMYYIPQDEKSTRKMKVIAKAEIRKRLGYSPNMLDALLLTYTAERYIQQFEIESHLYSRARG